MTSAARTLVMFGGPEFGRRRGREMKAAWKHANDRVGLATQRSAEGKHLSAVVTDSDQKVGDKIVVDNQARQRRSGPIELKHRDNTPVVEPTASPKEPRSSAYPSPLSKPPVAQAPQ